MKRTIWILAVTAVSLCLIGTTYDALARGGGGGGGGGGRGFGGGGYGGYRGDGGYRGFDDGRYRGGDFGDRNTWDGPGGADTSPDRGDAFSRPFNDGSAADPRAGIWQAPGAGFQRADRAIYNRDTALDDAANMSWNGGFAGRGLTTDMGWAGGAARAAGITSRVDDATLASRATGVRSSFNNYNAFNRGWWETHPNAWRNPYWLNDWAWGWTPWLGLAGYWGVDSGTDPIEYDYGDNITYQGDTVYYGSSPQVSVQEYYQQAQTIAQSGAALTPPASSAAAKSANAWKPLGVFSLVQGNETNSTTLFQLAVNSKGAISGNYYNVLTGDVKPVTGGVDKKSMRAAWTVSGNKDTVYDTGVSNLLKAQSPILIHFNKTNTQQWTMVRLQQPPKSTPQKASKTS